FTNQETCREATSINDYEDLQFPIEAGKLEGNVYWYGVEVNIPGKVNGRAVFKYMDAGMAIFAMNEFESPVQVIFTGYDWQVVLEDGTMYSFNMALNSVRSPSNTRTVKYDRFSTE